MINKSTPPLIQRSSDNTVEDVGEYKNREKLLETDDYDLLVVSGDDFFKFFSRKRLKLLLASISGLVGVLGNYYAIRHQISQTRFDMVASEFASDYYAFGLTVLLDLMIVIFHLMRINVLTYVTTASAVIISLYANISLIVQGHSIKQVGSQGMSDLQYGLSSIVSVTMAALPVVILTYLMHLVMEQYDAEVREKNKILYGLKTKKNEDIKIKKPSSTASSYNKMYDKHPM